MARANYSLAQRSISLIASLRRRTVRFIGLLLNDQSGVLLLESGGTDNLLSEN